MMIRPCCDNPTCPYCYGSGMAEVTDLEDKALEVLALCSVSDLSISENTATVRQLAVLALAHAAVAREARKAAGL